MKFSTCFASLSNCSSSSLALSRSLFCLFPFPCLAIFSLFLSYSLCIFPSLPLSPSVLRRLWHFFSLLSRSIARRGRGDAATPCPSIPLRLAARGSQPWSKYFVISLPDSRNGRYNVAAGSAPPLFAYVIDCPDDPNNTRYERDIAADLGACRKYFIHTNGGYLTVLCQIFLPLPVSIVPDSTLQAPRS